MTASPAPTRNLADAVAAYQVAGSPGKCARVIHVVERIDRQAVETWLLRMLRHARRRGIAVDWTFYCQLPEAGAMEEEALALGAKVIRSPVPIRHTVRFIRHLRSTLKRGDYAVLHAHHDLISAVYLVAAAGLPITRRITHIHNADEAALTSSRLKLALYRPILRTLCLVLSDAVVGISRHTLSTFLRGRAPRHGRHLVHYYGVDGSPFRNASGDRDKFRSGLGLAADTPILLFVGRMVSEKNPVFAVEVLAAMKTLDPRVAAVFVGSGPEEEAVIARAQRLGVADSVRLMGWRGDVAGIMTACDWFIHPRLEHQAEDRPLEGLGLVIVEAQLAGLRLLLSRAVPDDALLPEAVAAHLSLRQPAIDWARRAIELLRIDTPRREAMQAILASSAFDMDFALDDLVRMHDTGPRPDGVPETRQPAPAHR